ncbi:hypothetical protein ACFVWX_22580 [Streptomyces sp. NPDC058220]|uniref:hypothetical protein n=1 Tax=Streptomyces sp. NPDC058220 TaxID=3346387 RepID=UPI0036E1BBA8
MADERDAWLDKDAAERLLRGEPVEAADEAVRARAERLSGALRDVAAVTYANDAELPGEAAALAAFQRARSAGGERAGRMRAGELLGTVRLAPAPRARRAAVGRPVRMGLVAAVAGCALGGMAAATGAGALPSLFGGEHNPVPANSVSSVPSPRPLASGSSGGGSSAGPSDAPAGTGQPTPESSSAADPGKGHGAAEDGKRGKGEPAGPDSGHGDRPGSPDNDAGAWYRKTVEACRDYLSGEIDAARRDALESAAKGPQGVERFCGRLLAGDGKGGGGGKGGKDEGGKDDGDGDGSPGVPTAPPTVPPISWSPSPFEPPTPTPTVTLEPTSPPEPTATPQLTLAPDASPDADADADTEVHVDVDVAVNVDGAVDTDADVDADVNLNVDVDVDVNVGLSLGISPLASS